MPICSWSTTRSCSDAVRARTGRGRPDGARRPAGGSGRGGGHPRAAGGRRFTGCRSNEELQTLNDELRERTVEADQVNGFLQGVLSGLDLAVAVVDVEYRVQLWNSQAEQLTGLRSFEANGRRLTQLPLALPVDDVAGLLAGVVLRRESSRPLDVEVADRFGAARTRRIRATPLRRGASVDGAVVTLSDTAAGA